jgi:hypothetical protein
MHGRFKPHLSQDQAVTEFDEMLKETLKAKWVEVVELIHIGVSKFK